MKDGARAAAVAAVRDGGFGPRELVVRANALDTRWGADNLAALSEAGPAAILVPKVASPEDIDRYNAAIAHAPAATRPWVMIESAQAVPALAAIAATADDSKRVGEGKGV